MSSSSEKDNAKLSHFIDHTKRIIRRGETCWVLPSSNGQAMVIIQWHSSDNTDNSCSLRTRTSSCRHLTVGIVFRKLRKQWEWVRGRKFSLHENPFLNCFQIQTKNLIEIWAWLCTDPVYTWPRAQPTNTQPAKLRFLCVPDPEGHIGFANVRWCFRRPFTGSKWGQKTQLQKWGTLHPKDCATHKELPRRSFWLSLLGIGPGELLRKVKAMPELWVSAMGIVCFWSSAISHHFTLLSGWRVSSRQVKRETVSYSFVQATKQTNCCPEPFIAT